MHSIGWVQHRVEQFELTDACECGAEIDRALSGVLRASQSEIDKLLQGGGSEDGAFLDLYAAACEKTMCGQQIPPQLYGEIARCNEGAIARSSQK